jgi:hypothetical protein
MRYLRGPDRFEATDEQKASIKNNTQYFEQALGPEEGIL